MDQRNNFSFEKITNSTTSKRRVGHYYMEIGYGNSLRSIFKIVVFFRFYGKCFIVMDYSQPT